MENLGIEPIQLITQLLNFLVMVVILTKFLYKPILRILSERKAKIAEGIAYAEKMRQDAQKADEKKAAIIASAKEQAHEIVEESKKSGKLVADEIIEKARLEASSIVEKGKGDVENARITMEEELKEKTVAIATAMASKILEQAMTAKDQRLILSKKITTISKQLSRS